MVSFKEKTQSNRRLTRLFDAEDDRLGAKRRRFRFFKQGLMFGGRFLYHAEPRDEETFLAKSYKSLPPKSRGTSGIDYGQPIGGRP